MIETAGEIHLVQSWWVDHSTQRGAGGKALESSVALTEAAAFTQGGHKDGDSGVLRADPHTAAPDFHVSGF